MALDPSSIRSRRAIVGAGLGTLAALAAQAIGRPLPAAAGGQSVIMGQTNTSDQAATTLDRQDGKSNVSLAGPGYAIATHVFAADGSGIVAFSDATGARAITARTQGSSSQVALEALTTSGNGEGVSLHAETKNGIAVLAECTGGEAIRVNGMAVFSRSGKETFAAGQSKKTVASGRLSADSLVIATIQGDVAGTWVRGVTVNVVGPSFTIRLNKAAPKALTVGWFIVN